MRLFDCYMIVDWSAANSRARGKDSIWIAEFERDAGLRPPQNIPTRHEAMALILARCEKALQDEARLFIGVDFAFGYPAGAAARLTGKACWRALWNFICTEIEDDTRNKSNRFEVAQKINRHLDHADGGPFWGHPPQHHYDHLKPTKPASLPIGLAEKRIVEQRTAGAKSVWQLFYNGAVGSQSLLGIAQLCRLMHQESLKDSLAIWPFETRFAQDLTKPITIAEIYPSAFEVAPLKDEIKDAAQVRSLAQKFAQLDKQGLFKDLLDAPAGLTEKERLTILQEEGWIVGAR